MERKQKKSSRAGRRRLKLGPAGSRLSLQKFENASNENRVGQGYRVASLVCAWQ